MGVNFLEIQWFGTTRDTEDKFPFFLQMTSKDYLIPSHTLPNIVMQFPAGNYRIIDGKLCHLISSKKVW